MREFQPGRPLRPLHALEVIGASLRVLLTNLPALALVPVVTVVGLAAALAVVIAPPVLYGAAVSPAIAGALSGDGSQADWLGATALLVAFGFLVVLAVAFAIVWVSAGVAALTAVAGAGQLGRPLGTAAALGVGLRRALPLLGSSILVRLAVGVLALPTTYLVLTSAYLLSEGARAGNALLQVTALPLAVLAPVAIGAVLHIALRLSFGPFAAVFEDVGVVASLRRSWALTRGHTLRILGYAVLVGLLVGAAWVAIWGYGPAAAWWQSVGADRLSGASAGTPGALADPGGAAAQALTSAPAVFAILVTVLPAWLCVLIVQIVFVVLYFDIRRRDEGFGAEVAESLPIEAPIPAEATAEWSAAADDGPLAMALPAPAIADGPGYGAETNSYAAEPSPELRETPSPAWASLPIEPEPASAAFEDMLEAGDGEPLVTDLDPPRPEKHVEPEDAPQDPADDPEGPVPPA